MGVENTFVLPLRVVLRVVVGVFLPFFNYSSYVSIGVEWAGCPVLMRVPIPSPFDPRIEFVPVPPAVENYPSFLL